MPTTGTLAISFSAARPGIAEAGEHDGVLGVPRSLAKASTAAWPAMA